MDTDLRHYEGDHLVFRPTSVSPEDVFDAYQQIPAAFYTWGAIFRRWWRLMKAYWTSPHGRHKLWRTPILTAILFQLSRFQRVHGRRKVAPVMAQEREKWRKIGAERATA